MLPLGVLQGADTSANVPPIPSHFMEAVVFLYCDETSARLGTGSAGSGFLARIGMGEGLPSAVYVVTNDHVARQATAVRIADPDGRRPPDVIETPQDEWLRHPDGDDVAVFPLGMGRRAESFYYSAISPGNFMHAVGGKSWLGPGEDVFLLGRHIGSDGVNVDTPMARFGHIAAPPVKIRNRYRGIDQLSYLVEVLSRTGYSGSPVIVFRLQLETPHMGGVRIAIGEPRDRTLKGQFGMAGQPTLLGINWGHVDEPSSVLMRADEYDDALPHPDRLFVRQNSGLAAVVPAWKINDILWSEELEQMRAEQLAECVAARRSPPAS